MLKGWMRMELTKLQELDLVQGTLNKMSHKQQS